MDLFKGLDWGTYYFFRFQANRLPDFNCLMQVGDWLGSYLAGAIVLAISVIIAPRPGRWRLALVVVVTSLLGGLLIEGVAAATQRPRPPDAQNTLGALEMSSFPSRGVFLAAYAWLILAMALERRTSRRAYRSAIYACAALGIIYVCVSELWLGLNFVTDVLAGFSGGIGLALVARWAATEPGASRNELGLG